MGRTIQAVGGPAREIDTEQVTLAAGLLFDSTAGVQLQSLPSGRSVVIAGGDVAGLVRAVTDMNADVPHGIYFGLNPIPADLGRPMRVPDVLARRLLLLDFDRVKDSNTADQSSTEQERDRVRELAGRVDEYLFDRGWPAPAILDSGNGTHLLYRVDLANDDEARQLVKAVLAVLADRFDCADAQLDRKNYNANRISKLPGTWARKGTDTPERPHRLAQFVGTPPASLEVVKQSQLVALVAELIGQTVVESKNRLIYATSSPTLTPAERAARYVAKMPESVSGQHGHDRCFAVACRLVIDFNLPESEAWPILREFNSRCVPPWTEKELAHKLADAAKQPGERGKLLHKWVDDTPVVRNGVHAPGAPKATTFSVEIIAADALMKMKLPEPRWAVPGVMPEGLVLLAGRPKIGKSWLALGLSLAIAQGGKSFGASNIQQGTVLYLALEDHKRRLQDRIGKIITADGSDAPHPLKLATSWPRLDDTGLDLLDRWVQEQEGKARLVIVDVWPKARPNVSSKNSNAYTDDYAHASMLQEFATSRRVSVLALVHCRKLPADDPLDTISGTLGISGAADGILVMARDRCQNDATLFVTGRDVDETKLALRFDGSAATWSVVGNAEQVRLSAERRAVIDCIRSTGHPMRPKEIAEMLSKSPGGTRKIIHDMVQAGQLNAVEDGYYAVTPVSLVTPVTPVTPVTL
jgi:hypothetical protein